MIRYIYKDDKKLPYEVVIKRNKHTYMRIKDGVVVVTTNKQMVHLVESFLVSKFDKLFNTIHKVQATNPKEIKLQGQIYELNFEVGRFTYAKLTDLIMVSGKDLETAKKHIYLKEIKEMMKSIHPKVLAVIKNSGLQELPIKYKYLKSKFGSYHRKHDEITLNSFLATLDPIYLEYVLYHEYAHKIVFNHSKDFYDILDTWMPGHKNIQKALKKMAII